MNTSSQASQKRLNGTVKSWNDDRGFGFIAPSHGVAEVFVHISALPRDGTRPAVGESVMYELGRGKDGRPQAVNVTRKAMAPVSRKPTTRHRADNHRQPILPRLIRLVLLISLGVYGYSHYQNQVTVTTYSAEAQPYLAPAKLNTAVLPESGNFRCDGRTHCSQMTSCSEAKYFLSNCSGTQMDGNNDGIPCERQWCTGPLAK
jgi:cold shock CspA family protein